MLWQVSSGERLLNVPRPGFPRVCGPVWSAPTAKSVGYYAPPLRREKYVVPSRGPLNPPQPAEKLFNKLMHSYPNELRSRRIMTGIIYDNIPPAPPTATCPPIEKETTGLFAPKAPAFPSPSELDPPPGCGGAWPLGFANGPSRATGCSGDMPGRGCGFAGGGSGSLNGPAPRSKFEMIFRSIPWWNSDLGE